MAFKKLATAVLLLGVAGCIQAQEQQPVTASAKEQAEARARAELAQHLKVAPEDITVSSSEPQTWRDSSMGCGKPGTMALTVITEGYAVMLAAQGREHSVHVAGDKAVICNRGTIPHRE